MMPSAGLAVLSYRTGNIGDDIQSLAAARLLSGPLCRVDRDFGTLQCLQPETHERHRLLANGWYSHNPLTWPWAPEILPLLISMHLSGDVDNPLGVSARDWNLRPEFSEYLTQWGPVGARDLSTLAALQAAGVPSFMSGCLTLTLPEHRGPRRARSVLVDVPEDLARAVFPHLPEEVTRESHTINVRASDEDRLEHARRLVDLYATSQLVVTTRLHAALPAVASGTPVLFLDVGQMDGRFDGLREFLRIVPPGTHHDWEDLVSAALIQPPTMGHTSLRDGILSQVQAWLDQTDPDARPHTEMMRSAAALAEAQARGRRLEAAEAERERLVQQHKEVQAKHATEVQELKDRLQHLSRLSLEQQQLNAVEQQQLNDELRAEQSRTSSLAAELAALRASSSWRVTAPMRHVRNVVRRG